MTKIYTHGFEEIYALEKVDVRSIRPMLADEVKKPVPKPQLVTQRKIVQLQLQLGDLFVESLSSFILTEPIQQLRLARHLEAWLISRSIVTIEQLMKTVFEDLPSANLHEIHEKIDAYVGSRALYDTDQVDYAAWIRGLIGVSQPLMTYVLLEQWGLEDIIELEPQDRMELRRLTEDRKKAYCDEQRQKLLFQKDIFSKAMRRVVDALIRPWIRLRSGLATKLELNEQLLAIAEDVTVAKKVIPLFNDIFSNGSFILDRFLYHADVGLYCYDSSVAEAYDIALEKATTYFYQDHLDYKLEHLETLIHRELANQWNGFPAGFLQKVLRLAPQFVVRRGDDDQLHVRLR